MGENVKVIGIKAQVRPTGRGYGVFINERLIRNYVYRLDAINELQRIMKNAQKAGLAKGPAKKVQTLEEE